MARLSTVATIARRLAALILVVLVCAWANAADSSIGKADIDDRFRSRDASSHYAKSNIAVVLPDIGEPFRSIFGEIVNGIKDKARVPVRTYKVGELTVGEDLSQQLKKNGAKVVIALGRQGVLQATSLERDLPVVIGGFLSMPEGVARELPGISLTPDPGLLFARLKDLASTIRRVHVIYDPHNTEWLIRQARDAAKALGIELQTHEARDIAAAVRAYERVFASMDPRRDALWLPQDATTVSESTIVPMVLKESWERDILVFSSSLLHVKRGALFSLYPNNRELGRSLADLAQQVSSGGPYRRGVQLLRDTRTAVNMRAAQHLDVTLSEQQLRTFDTALSEM